jgi:hypothetical protein
MSWPRSTRTQPSPSTLSNVGHSILAVMFARVVSTALTLTFALMLIVSTPRPASAAPGQVPSVTDARYFAGVNVPWFNWGCDFGCGEQNGVRSPAVNAALKEGFGRLKAAGVHTVRWWTFEGDPAQIIRDSSGAPTGLNPAVYADFEAALALAEQYDLAYVFVLFSAPTALPSPWLTDPGQRQKLASALAPLFERYKNHPRILAWEFINEPEYDIWGNKVSKEAVQATVKLLASTVKANSSTLTTVGAATVEGVPMWSGLGLDFHSPHWYDQMDSGVMCARCTDVPTLRSTWITDGLPIVLGEFYGGPDVDSLQRLNDFRSKGYAGAWTWSLFFDKTMDRKRTDLAALTTFVSIQAPTPALAQSPLPTSPLAIPAPGAEAQLGSPVQLLSNWVSPTYVIAGESITLHQDIRSAQDIAVLVDFEIHSSGGEKVSQVALDNQSLAAGERAAFSTSITVPKTLPSGTYTLKTGAFAPGWGTMFAWNDAAGTFVVEAAPAPPRTRTADPAADSPALEPEGVSD